MMQSPEVLRLHRHFLWLGICWGTISVATILFNPIGDMFDSVRDSTYGQTSLGVRISWVQGRVLPPYNSVQFLVALHAPIIALFAGLRYRWTAIAGVGTALAYVLFTAYVLLDRSVNDDLLLINRQSIDVAIVRILGAALWSGPAIPLILRLERLRKEGNRYDRLRAGPRAIYVFQGKVANARLVWLYATGFRLLGSIFALAAVAAFAIPPLGILVEGLTEKNAEIVMNVSGVLLFLGLVAAALSIPCFRQKPLVIYATLPVAYLLTASLAAYNLVVLKWSVRHLVGEAEAAPMWISVGFLVYVHAMLWLTWRLQRAGLPPSIRPSQLERIEQAELAGQ